MLILGISILSFNNFGLVGVAGETYLSDIRKFEGYLVFDYYINGFFACDGANPMSYTDLRDKGYLSNHPRLDKHHVEPEYVAVLGRITDQGGYGFSEFHTDYDWDKNLEIYQLLKLEDVSPSECDANMPSVRYDEWQAPTQAFNSSAPLTWTPQKERCPLMRR